MIRFGSMSITLLIGAMYGLLFAVLLWFSRTNRLANRFLALLLVTIALRMLPYIIGYAGYYDAYPWLSFLPYNLSLAIGPLIYFYVSSLSRPNLPAGWWRHFLPVSAQFAYYCIVFSFPIAAKNQWDDFPHAVIVYPLELAATFVSMGIYLRASLRRYHGYQDWLAANMSQLEEHRITWVRNFLLTLAVTLAFWIALVLFDRLIAKLDYFQQFPFYVWLGVLVYYLGTEGYRNATHRYPSWEFGESAFVEKLAPVAAGGAVEVQIPTQSRDIDWSARGEQWRARLSKQEWWRDPELSLDALARKLGTNTSDLSRAINEGLGMNFNEMINRLRVEAVKSALSEITAPTNLLEVAFAAGFSSKASFNRSFKLYVGATPSEFRQRRKA